jgi:hypothetical protein
MHLIQFGHNRTQIGKERVYDREPSEWGLPKELAFSQRKAGKSALARNAPDDEMKNTLKFILTASSTARFAAKYYWILWMY